MVINGDLEVSGTQNHEGDLVVNGDVGGRGTLIVGGRLVVNGDIDGMLKISAGCDIVISGDVMGLTNMEASSITVQGDVSLNGLIKARTVVINGDRGFLTRIEAGSVIVNGTDERAPKVSRDPLPRVPAAGGGNFSVDNLTLRNVTIGGRSHSSGSCSVNGQKTQWTSDGMASVVNGRIYTQSARKTTIEFNDASLLSRAVRLEVLDADIDRDGIVRGGTVTLKGEVVAPNCKAGVDLSKLPEPVSRIYKPS